MISHVRTSDSTRRVIVAGLACVLFGISLLAGCGPAPVTVKGEPEDAASVLNDALEEWKGGKKVEDLNDADPPMIVRDQDWENGATLKAYEVNKSPRKEGSSWRVEATITVVGKGLPSGPQVVSYGVTLEERLISIQRKDNLE